MTRAPLPDVDPDLAAGIPAEDVPLARRALALRLVDVPAGEWAPPPPDELGDAFALLVLKGLLTRDTTLCGRTSAKLVGPQELVHPWVEDSEEPRASVVWRAGEPTRLLVLDERFLMAARRWPDLMRRLCRRQALQAVRDARHLAIMHITPVEQRVLALLRHLGARWGRTAPGGVVLPLHLTHEALGRLVGAQRPTVTLALAALDAEGVIARRGGVWVLREPAGDDGSGVTPLRLIPPEPARARTAAPR